MSNKNTENRINELKNQRKIAMQSFEETNIIKNEALAEYFFHKFKEGTDVPYSILQDVPVGEALLLPVVYGGAIITIKERVLDPNEIIYTTKWTPGSTLTMHYHSDCNEIIEVVSGKIKIYTQGITETIKEGDKVEVSLGIPHQVTALSSAELRITFKKLL